MNYITVALLSEASPIISHFALQKSDDKRFSIYENKTIKLIISGIGKINSASATTYLLQRYQATKEDKIFNIGTCTTTKETIMIGELFHISKMIDFSTNSVYHLKNGEQAITCVDKALDSAKNIKTPLADMESVGVYLAAKRFITMEHIMIVKIVSDKTDKTIPKAEETKALIEEHIQTIEEMLS